MYRKKNSTSKYVQSKPKLMNFACQPVHLAFPRVFHSECVTQSVEECPCKNVSLKLSYHEALPRVLLGECPWNNG